MKANLDEFENKIIRKNRKIERPHKIEKLELLMQEMEALSAEDFTGYVKINFTQGGIGRVEKFEEILKNVKDKS